jgi:hypothetical protein
VSNSTSRRSWLASSWTWGSALGGTILASILVLGQGACVRTTSRTIVRVPHEDEVPVGTEFAVRLTTPIGTSLNEPGDSFVAASVTPLRAADGSLVAPEGAKTTGKGVGVDEGPAASLRIEFESIDTVSGSAPLSATVEAEPSALARYRTEPIYSTQLPYTAVLLPISTSGDSDSVTPRDRSIVHRVNLPAGTPLGLVLMRPLAPAPTP